MRYGGIVNWQSRRQKSTALSSMHAEIMSGCDGAKEMAWMEKLRMDLKEPTDYIPTLFIDNQAAVDWCKDAKFHDRSKHIEIQFYYTRNDMVQRNRLKVQQIPETDQIADILIKQLPLPQFQKLKEAMGVGPSI